LFILRNTVCLLPLLLCLPLAASAQSASSGAAPGAAQTPATSASISGTITDSTGGIVPQISITLENLATHRQLTVKTDESGTYLFAGVAPGRYVLTVSLPGFDPYRGAPLTVATAAVQSNVQLRLADVTQSVTVSADATTLDPATNASSTELDNATLDTLPDDPTDLLTQLQSLAGGNGATLYIDGFSAATLPPKSSILQVRINSDPYSSENDTSPVSGSIQVITRPGVERIHGNVWAAGNASSFNARNPFAPSQPPYNSDQLNGSINGPITKNSSYDINFYQNSNRTNAIVDTKTLDASNNQVEINETVPNPSHNFFLSNRVKFQPAPTDILSLQYAFSPSASTNSGVGQTTLPSYGTDNSSYWGSSRLSNLYLSGQNIANTTRMQWDRSTSSQTPVSTAPTISVTGAFTGGGNAGGANNTVRDHFELQNYLMVTHGKHNMEFGTRIRSDFYTLTSRSGFNGTFVFSAPANSTLTSLDVYQQTLQGVPGAEPTLYTVSQGTPTVSASMSDGAVFAQDDWKARTNLTISGGLRFESQAGLPDHADVAPRAGFSWSLDKDKHWVVRGGSGLFYFRFPVDNILTVRRQNGANVLSYSVTSGIAYPAAPAVASGTPSNIYQRAANLRTAYQAAVEGEIDRSLGKHGSLAFTARRVRGVHGLLVRNANAPLPGTYDPTNTNSGIRPFGCCQQIDQYTSEGESTRTQLIFNTNLNFGKHGSFYGNYVLGWLNSDSSGGFPSNQYDLSADAGRDSGDVRQSFYAGYSVPLPIHFHLNGSVSMRTGVPFNITTGSDPNGDQQYNDRPSFATDLTRASVVETPLGNFDTDPIAGQTIIPINYGEGPPVTFTYLSLTHTFNFFPEPPEPDPKAKPDTPPPPGPKHPYALDLSINAENALNHPNYANPVGTLDSPNFDKSLAIATQDRTLRFTTQFRF